MVLFFRLRALLSQLQISAGAGKGRADLDLIFERFYKGDTARRKGSSGLGLYIVRELTHRMGGDVHVELEAGNAVNQGIRYQI